MADQKKPTDPKEKLAELNRNYLESDNADQLLFSEQRSNCLLVSGDHFTRKGSKFWNRIRDNKELSNEQKLRITKNHIQRICKRYVSNILMYAPSVTVSPNNEAEIQDQKAAELNAAVWTWLKKRHNIRKKTREYVKDFVDIGEVAVKIFWDPMGGEFKGYHQAIDEMGMGSMDPSGQPMPDESKPAFTGGLVYERIFGFNLLRAAQAKSMDESPYLTIRKMADIHEMRIRVGEDEAKLKALESASKDETYLVFDSSRGDYRPSKDQVLIKETYYRPCPEYPRGYYYIYTTTGILWEGELPFGIFPIIYEGFDPIPTTPRHHSIIKQLRPYQAEVNRSASQIALHQIVLGDDKIIYQSGSTMENGGYLPGIRGVKMNGAPPTVLPGRTGEQYLPYMQSQIAEMYQVADLELDDEAMPQNADPYTSLYQNLRQRKKLSIYGEKIEEFLIKLCEVSLDFCRYYLPDEVLIPAVGKKEFINLDEFRTSDCLGYHITLEAQEDDIETKFGRQLTFNHVLQYVGGNLEKEDLGKLIRNLPYANTEESFSDLTLDYDNVKNDMLAMERGKPRPPKKYDNHKYMIKKLTARTRQPDFEFLDPQIQSLYANKISEHEQMESVELQQLKMAESELIPTTGYAVVCDLYVPQPGNPEKTQRARVPYDSLKWLLEKMQNQGTTQEALAGMPQSVLAELTGVAMRGAPQAMGGQEPQQGSLQQGPPQLPPITG